jgi:hypothetical protein
MAGPKEGPKAALFSTEALGDPLKVKPPSKPQKPEKTKKLSRKKR